MSGQAGVGRDGCCLCVANFTDHDDVGGLPQNRSERDRKRHPHVRVYLHLINAGHLIFDRLFHGNDLAVGLVDEVQTGVKSARFSRAGRTGDEQDAVRAT